MHPKTESPREKKGIAERLFANSRSIPKPKKPWRQMSSIERSRLKDARALWRRKNQKGKYRRVGRMIAKIRERMGMTPEQFAGKLEVSIITLRRWERGYGYSPRPDLMDQIKKLGRKENVKRRTNS